jgi:hypothetical protein
VIAIAGNQNIGCYPYRKYPDTQKDAPSPESRAKIDDVARENPEYARQHGHTKKIFPLTEDHPQMVGGEQKQEKNDKR